MMSSKRKSGPKRRQVMRQLEEPQTPRRDGYYAGRITEERELEIRAQYCVKGWTEVEGLITLGFVSHCGEYFNCYCKKTGHFYSFGTDEALKARIAAQRKAKGECV